MFIPVTESTAETIQRLGQRSDDRARLFKHHACHQSLARHLSATLGGLKSFRHNNKRRTAMLKFKHSKVRQAGLILFTTALLLIVPNLNRLFG
ncbi:hypothetical protein ALQ33_102035 [Pseudomonas syringae pv. philadelphi]|uniref:Uncharacterized protein n=1 Tax=Pseudomonas syringae pv. philadelphi TaxID=251706 RepID=A0A3M3ZTB0_9PSED|nr:hypothetical protein ALQ33_102035 [Pseudomonas syringae pv. philadelphi]